MKKLKIVYKGGYNQVSNYLIREHDANFAVIVDALVNIYNMKIDKLVKIGSENAVEISNGYLSRNIGLGHSIVKSNVVKIEEIGLVTVIKKGKSNTRHYVIHIERINSYIKALEGKFNQWFKDSLEFSKKDKERSNEADLNKIKSSLKRFEENMKMTTASTEKPPIRLVDNQPTKKINTTQPNNVKPTVADIKEKTIIKTTTKSNNVVVGEIFDQTDSKGMFIKIEAYDKTIYKSNYENYIAKHTKEYLERKFEEFEQQEFDDSLNIDDEFDEEKKHPITNDRSMMYIYNQVHKLEVKKLRQAKREYETTKKPANQETSMANWKRLENVYNDLPPKKNQGKFITSIKDKDNFYKLSEFRQEWVVAEVEAKKNETTTASRPANYINEAMKDRLRKTKKPNSKLNVAL